MPPLTVKDAPANVKAAIDTLNQMYSIAQVEQKLMDQADKEVSTARNSMNTADPLEAASKWNPISNRPGEGGGGGEPPTPPPPGRHAVRSAEREVDLGAGHHMDTVGVLYDDNSVQAMTHTWSTSAFGGFTGGVWLMFLDGSDNVLGFTNVHTFGVDGTWVGRSSRFDNWSQSLSADVRQGTASIRIAQAWAPQPRIANFPNLLREILNWILSVVRAFVDFWAQLLALLPWLVALF